MTGGTSDRESSTGIPAHVVAGLAYLLGWMGGVVAFVVERRNEEVRFHAAQSILLDIAFLAAAMVVFVPLWIGGFIAAVLTDGGWDSGPPVWFFAGGALYAFVIVSWMVVRITLTVQGFRFRHTRFPGLWRLAERWAQLDH